MTGILMQTPARPGPRFNDPYLSNPRHFMMIRVSLI